MPLSFAKCVNSFTKAGCIVGDTRETLTKMYPLVFEMCAEKGYNMTGRDHIIAFDTERGV